MKTRNKYILLIVLTLVILGFGTADAQQNLAQQVSAIFAAKLLELPRGTRCLHRGNHY